MSKWASDKENNHDGWLKEMNDLGYSDMWVSPQIDWSIDSEDDWHYNKYWDTEGYDENYKLRINDWAYISASYSSEKTMTEWVFRFGYDISNPDDYAWYGVHNEDEDIPGWVDVLKEDQYEIRDINGERIPVIDLDVHTVYFRVRWLVTCRDFDDVDTKVASEWSATAAVGKEEVSEAEVSSQEESKAPESKADSAIAEKTEKSSFPWWIIILIILMLNNIIVIIVLLNRKKKDEENKG